MSDSLTAVGEQPQQLPLALREPGTERGGMGQQGLGDGRGNPHPAGHGGTDAGHDVVHGPVAQHAARGAREDGVRDRGVVARAS